MELAEEFGYVLKKNREARELSQSDLALSSGLDRTFISLLERGQRQPSLATVFQLAAELRIDPAELVRQVTRALRQRARKKVSVS